MIVKNLSSNSDHGVHFFDHRVQTDHGVFIFSDHGVQMPLGEGSKVNTPSADRCTFSNRLQNQTRDSSSTHCAGPPCFQRFPRYSVHALCIK